MRSICARTSGSAVSRTISHTSVRRFEQKPACVQSVRSSVNVMPRPRICRARVSRGARSAVSVPSKPTRACDSSQNGLVCELPHRQSAYQRPVLSGSPSSVSTGSPHSVSTMRDVPQRQRAVHVVRAVLEDVDALLGRVRLLLLAIGEGSRSTIR